MMSVVHGAINVRHAVGRCFNIESISLDQGRCQQNIFLNSSLKSPGCVPANINPPFPRVIIKVQTYIKHGHDPGTGIYPRTVCMPSSCLYSLSGVFT